MGSGWVNRESRYFQGKTIVDLVCSKTESEMDNLLAPGGVDLSPLGHSEQGTRFRRLKRLFTEGHLFDVKYFPAYSVLIQCNRISH